MTCLELHHNTGQYALALQFGDYRAAVRVCLAALRRIRSDFGLHHVLEEEWRFRLVMCMRYRHEEDE